MSPDVPPDAPMDIRPDGPLDAPVGEGDLPDPETLGKDGDFAAYLRDGVPEVLQRRALRALWRSDPVLANLDGLNDYDEDFRHVGTVAQAVQTAWRAGRGYAVDDAAAAGSPDVAPAAEAIADAGAAPKIKTDAPPAGDDTIDAAAASEDGVEDAADAARRAGGPVSGG